MYKSSHLQKPTKIPVSAWDIFKKLVSYLVRSAQSASRGACLSWLSGKLQLCSSITQTRSSILSHKLPGTGGSSVVLGRFIIFWDQFLHSWLPQLEEQVGNVLAQLFVWGGSREFSRAGRSSRGTTAGAGLGSPGAGSEAWGWAGFIWPCSSASADGHTSLAAQTPQSIMIPLRELAFIPGKWGRLQPAQCCGCAGFQTPDSGIPPYKWIIWDLLLSWRSMELAPWNQGKLPQAACKISLGAD